MSPSTTLRISPPEDPAGIVPMDLLRVACGWGGRAGGRKRIEGTAAAGCPFNSSDTEPVGGQDQEVALFSDDPVLLNTRAMD